MSLGQNVANVRANINDLNQVSIDEDIDCPVKKEADDKLIKLKLPTCGDITPSVRLDDGPGLVEDDAIICELDGEDVLTPEHEIGVWTQAGLQSCEVLVACLLVNLDVFHEFQIAYIAICVCCEHMIARFPNQKHGFACRRAI